MITQSCPRLKNMLIFLLISKYWSRDWNPSSAAQKHHPSKSKYRVSIIHCKTGRKKRCKLNNVKMANGNIFSNVKKKINILNYRVLLVHLGDVCFAFILPLIIFVCYNEIKSLWRYSLYETVILFSKCRKKTTFCSAADGIIEVPGFYVSAKHFNVLLGVYSLQGFYFPDREKTNSAVKRSNWSRGTYI